MSKKAYVGMKLDIGSGTATVTKVYGNIVKAELRDLPKVKRPCGMFYQKHIFQYPFTEYHKQIIAAEKAKRESTGPPAPGREPCPHCGQVKPDNFQHCPHCLGDCSREGQQ